ncbi:hypothetical protein FE697_019810 [Mumia zhuanghuii]|uniref:Uncharacterized protein n=2 Tax=Mumia TaxID=1546255 RepID=A0ABW1QQS4_9ACTN|nr:MULTISPECIES: hypothetical protein [Mumia]KAA1418099.1 hypothetical protein FE697_019810 [Mumia zhuanghuii]
MRRVAGFGLLALGVVIAVVGAVGAVAFGPDDRMTTGTREVDTDARAVVTRPAVLARYGPQVSVQVELPDDKPVFLGLASTVDVDDYLESTQRVEITRYRVPWSVTTKDVAGDPFLPAAPTALDWWLEATSGVGGAQLRFELPDETVSLAVLAMGDADLSGLRVTGAYEVPGAFGVSLGAAVGGLGIALLGVVVAGLVPAVRRRTPSLDAAAFVDDEWDEPWLETDPADADTWDDFLEESDPTAPTRKPSKPWSTKLTPSRKPRSAKKQKPHQAQRVPSSEVSGTDRVKEDA